MDALDGFMNKQKPERRGSQSGGLTAEPQPAPAPRQTQPTPAAEKARKYACPPHGYSEDANKDFRPYMEDAHVVVEDFLGDGTGYFGLYDGHGGKQAVDFVVARLHDAVYDQIEKDNGSNMNRGIKADTFDQAFLRCDDLLKKAGAFRCGTTVVVCIITVEEGVRQLYTLNCGDSRAVMVGKGGGVTRLSYDDKSTDPAEIKRVLDDGGAVFRDRVAGALAVTRSLGDWALKDCGVIATPHFDKRPLNADNLFLILASDGLWDVISDQDVANIAVQFTDPQMLSAALMKKALDLGTRDNISCLCVKLQH